ncbi:MAG: RecX family transcriptional regulator [Cyclobacteriaceae bacterium]|nr:RecX family transcriptional regulator [Cyclobacteriaceae bacterium]
MAVRSNVSETSRRRYSPEEAFTRICRYCAYQERSHKEVRAKLFSYGLFSSQVEELLSRLITEGFLNEERFARAFAGGKFRMQKWGRLKIVRALETHGLSGRCIQRGLKEIDGTAYTKVLRQLLTRKLAGLNEANLFKARQKAAQFAIGKGYEPELVWELLRDLTQE